MGGTVESGMKLVIISMNILVVDDEPALRRLTKLILTKFGHVVETASNGADALSLLGRSSVEFDLVLTDHHMPKVNGLELVQTLKENDFEGDVVVWSGAFDAELVRQYQGLGVRKCLSKPVPIEVMTRIVGEVADKVAA